MRRRRRLVAGAMIVGGKSEQINEASCRPASWQTEKRALSPLATHRSNRARKSSLVTAANVDGGVGCEIGGDALGCTSSRTRPAHEGTAQGPRHLPVARGRRGETALTRPAYTCHHPHVGGGGLAGGVLHTGCC
jgi:hypothetical protein